MKWVKCSDEAPPGDKACDLRIITWDGFTVRENIRRWDGLMHCFRWDYPEPIPTHWIPFPDPPPMPPTQLPE